MRSRYKIHHRDGIHFVTSSTVNWLSIFTSEKYFNILIEALSYRLKRKKLMLFSYVLMEDHFHAILCSQNLTKFMKEFKSYTARRIIDQLRIDNNREMLVQLSDNKKHYKSSSRYQVWQEGFHPQLIQGMDMFRLKADYIHMNPVRRSYVKKPEGWEYSSASNYISGTGLLEINSII